MTLNSSVKVTRLALALVETMTFGIGLKAWACLTSLTAKGPRGLQVGRETQCSLSCKFEICYQTCCKVDDLHIWKSYYFLALVAIPLLVKTVGVVEVLQMWSFQSQCSRVESGQDQDTLGRMGRCLGQETHRMDRSRIDSDLGSIHCSILNQERVC